MSKLLKNITSSRRSPGWMRIALGLLLAAAIGARCGAAIHFRLFAGVDEMLSGDWYNALLERYDELVPGAPLVSRGPDGMFGTADDSVAVGIVGDTDLILRSGITGFAGAIPDPSPFVAGGSEPLGVAGISGLATAIDFVVVATDGLTPAPYGTPVAPPYFEGLPILAAAFPDLDGDGFVGVTLEDGIAADAGLEAAELVPVGRNFAFASGDRAAGSLVIAAGGPSAAPLRVALTAFTFTGLTDPGFLGGSVPTGALVMTHLPFFPVTDPNRIFQGGPSGPPPALPGDLIAVKVKPDLVPDPTNPGYGEAFTLRTDGSTTSIDVAVMQSGVFARFGLVRVPDAALYRVLDSRPLHRGLDDLGGGALYEVPQHISVEDDGGAGSTTLRVVPLDLLGNISDAPGSSLVTIRVGSGLEIISPDTDGLVSEETVTVSDAAGVELVLGDTGGVFDNANGELISVEGRGALFQLGVTIPDPDVNDDFIVDGLDVAAVTVLEDIEEGDPGFDSNLDLDGNGFIDLRDIAIVNANLDVAVPIP